MRLMSGKHELCFIDTNIWLYACIQGDDADKSITANALIRESLPIVSTQVINEICVNLVRKARFEETLIRKLIDAFYDKYPVIELGQTILVGSSQVRERYGFSFWDGLIVSCALSAGVNCLYSEDMQHGLVIDSKLRIVNPFI